MPASAEAAHPFSPGSGVIDDLAPGGRSLIERSVYGSVPLWWWGRVQLHERTLRKLRFGGTEQAHRVDPRPLSVTRLALHVLMGRAAAARIRVEGLEEYQNATRRILYPGQNRQWPGEGGAPSDRFFGPILARLAADGTASASTYPMSGAAFPWYRPVGRTAARDRNRSEVARPHLPFEGFVGPGTFRAFTRAVGRFEGEAQTIAAHWGEVADEVPALQDPLVSAVVRDAVLGLFRTVFPVAVLHLEAARNAVRRLRPHLVVLLNEYGILERALQTAAQENGIPALAIQHGVIHPYHAGYVYPAASLREDAAWRLRVPLPDKMLVYGDHHRAFLVEEVGWGAGRVLVTGHPNGDRVHRLLQGREAPSGERPPVVLWLTQIHGLPAGENTAHLQAILEAHDDMPTARLVVKPHPSDDLVDLREMSERSERIVVLDPRADLYHAIQEADVAITKDSTAALEAMAFDRPVVILNPTSAPDRVDYATKGAALRAHDGKTLAAALRTSLADDPTATMRRRYVREQFGPIDGKTTERIASAVRDYLA